MFRIQHFLRIVVALSSALCISVVVSSRYFHDSPQFDREAVNTDIKNSQVYIASFRLPQFSLPTWRMSTLEESPEEPYPTVLPDIGGVDPFTFEPTTLPQTPQSSSAASYSSFSSVSSRLNSSSSTPASSRSSSYRSIRPPTAAPNPTKAPKPTRPPDEFPIDPALKRPGTTPDEVFDIAAQKTCVPKAILRTIASIESGGFFSVVDPKWFDLYNSANWWNSEFTADPKQEKPYQRICSGYGYDNGSGLIEPDSKYAGENCHKDGSTGPRSYIMGPMQVNGSEQGKFSSKVASALGVKNVDRRIILDAIMIVGYITKQNVGNASCSNWSAKEVVKAACGYYGSCGIKDGTYYCATFCRNIKEYGGQDCSGAIKGDGCFTEY